MNDKEMNIELTAEEIEEVAGGVPNLCELILADAEFKPVTYMRCPRCKSWDDVCRVVIGNSPLPNDVHIVTFFCKRCNKIFEEKML